MTFLTVITPTYNRAELIKNLYESLEKQTDRDFIWLIVDDGSFDNTGELIRSFEERASFPIQYLRKENGGKHTALNEGIKQIQSELTIIVDSDDVLLPEAVSQIKKVHNKYKEDNSIGVYSFLRCYSDGTPIVSLKKDEFIESYIKYRIRENHPGDMAEVFKSNVLKAFPFPVFERERFLSEDVVWIQIGLKYLYVFINKPIYQCEYLKGGLTANDKPLKFSSPLGSMMRGKMLMKKECGFVANLKGAIIYNCYKKVNEKKKNVDSRLELNQRERILCAATILFSNFYYSRWHKA